MRPNSCGSIIPQVDEFGEKVSEGLTIRDYFAAAAMVGAFKARAPDFYEISEVTEARAEWAYMQADAMLKAR